MRDRIVALEEYKDAIVKYSDWFEVAKQDDGDSEIHKNLRKLKEMILAYEKSIGG